MKAKDRFILENFWQKEMNCSSIALIKAALITYGSSLFKKKTEKGGKALIITLKNRKKIRLKIKRLKSIAKKNGIGYSKGKTINDQAKIERLKKPGESMFRCDGCIFSRI